MFLICYFDVKKYSLLLSMLKTVVLCNIFVETVIFLLYFLYTLIKKKKKKKYIYILLLNGSVYMGNR